MDSGMVRETYLKGPDNVLRQNYQCSVGNSGGKPRNTGHLFPFHSCSCCSAPAWHFGVLLCTVGPYPVGMRAASPDACLGALRQGTVSTTWSLQSVKIGQNRFMRKNQSKLVINWSRFVQIAQNCLKWHKIQPKKSTKIEQNQPKSAKFGRLVFWGKNEPLHFLLTPFFMCSRLPPSRSP